MELFSPWLLPLDGEEENWPRTSSKKFIKKGKRGKGQIAFLTSENEGVKYVLGAGKEVNKMEEKKESAVPMWVLLIIIGIGAFFIVKFLIFSE